MIEFPIWAIVVLSVFAAPTAILALMMLLDLLVDLLDRR
jgi:hypothetical protein